LPKSERPRERLAQLGGDSLSLQELLAIVLETGNRKGQNAVEVASQLLKAFNGDLGSLFSASIEELSTVKGIGFAKACKIKAVFELGKRIISHCREERPCIQSSVDVVTLVLPHMTYLDKEEFRVILLDSKNRVVGNELVSVGSLDKTVVHPREVFRPAVSHAAASIICVHNHPSGDPTPSQHDILLTQDLCTCGKILDIEVIDHIIIGRHDYVSMKYRNLM
jgi:DNA repair protein RadC